MASALDIEVCAQMGDNDGIWVEACRLVKHDPNDNGEHVLVEIPGVRLRILKHQLIGASFMISSSVLVAQVDIAATKWDMARYGCPTPPIYNTD